MTSNNGELFFRVFLQLLNHFNQTLQIHTPPTGWVRIAHRIWDGTAIDADRHGPTTRTPPGSRDLTSMRPRIVDIDDRPDADIEGPLEGGLNQGGSRTRHERHQQTESEARIHGRRP